LTTTSTGNNLSTPYRCNNDRVFYTLYMDKKTYDREYKRKIANTPKYKAYQKAYREKIKAMKEPMEDRPPWHTIDPELIDAYLIDDCYNIIGYRLKSSLATRTD